MIIGGTPAIMDMRTGCLSLGAPEVSRLTSATVQLAKFYNLPARAGCAVPDAHIPDAQAGFELVNRKGYAEWQEDGSIFSPIFRDERTRVEILPRRGGPQLLQCPAAEGG